MSNIIAYPTNPSINQEFIVGATIKLWDGEKWVNKSFGNHEERLRVDRQTLEALIKSYGKNLGGLFDLGFSYVEGNDVGVTSDGKFWEWKGTLPYTVPKNTDPTLDPNFEHWEFATLDTLNADEIEETINRIWFTPELNSKLEGIESGAQVNTVTSVGGETGDVILNKEMVGLSNVDNTTDLDKPVSNATQEAIDLVSGESSEGLLLLETKIRKVRMLALAGL